MRQRVCDTDHSKQVLYLPKGADAKERKEKLYDRSGCDQGIGKDRTAPAERPWIPHGLCSYSYVERNPEGI